MHTLTTTSRNQQPAEPPVPFTGTYDVREVFPTIQGEGPLAGLGAVFIRLAGCNLYCPGCDTDYTTVRGHMTPEEVAKLVDGWGRQGDLVVVTGGEPFRQEVKHLVHALRRPGRVIQFETNGLLCIPDQVGEAPDVQIVCSPKTSGVHGSTRRFAQAWKYVVREGAVCPVDGLPLSALGMPYPPARPWPSADARPAEGLSRIWVQPEDEGDPERNRKNMAAAVASCVAHGYRLGCQLHKVFGLS